MRTFGVSLVELLVALALMGLALGIAALNLRPLSDPLQDALVQTEGYLKQVRAKAMATTSGYRVQVDPTGLRASYAPSCRASSFTEDTALRLDLPEGVRLQARWGPSGDAFASGDWFCFSSRGLLLGSKEAEPVLYLEDERGRTRTLRLLLGGGVVRP